MKIEMIIKNEGVAIFFLFNILTQYSFIDFTA